MADTTSGNGGSGSASDNASAGSGVNTADLERLINDTVSKAIGMRMKRLNLEEQIQKAVDAALSKAGDEAVSQGPESQAAGNPLDPEKTTKKELYEQFNRKLEAERKAREDLERKYEAAQAAEKDARIIQQVQAKMAARMGADNPLLPILLDSLYYKNKRFVDQEGRLSVKFTDPTGYEDFKPLDEGIEALFTGELKHLVQTSKAQQLPAQPNRMRPGMAPETIPQGQAGAGQRHPLYDVVSAHYAAHGDQAAAAAFSAHGSNGNGSNGTK